MINRYALIVFALLSPTQALSETFCEIAARSIPFLTSTAANVEVIDQSVWSSSREQDFQTEEEFSEWSRANDSGASYKMFSFSHGSQSRRQAGSFQERYQDYSRSFAESISLFRSNNAVNRSPSIDYINNVLSGCTRDGPIFVVVVPGTDLTSFSAQLYLDTPGPVGSQNITITNAECREGNGRFVDKYSTAADSAILECRRLNNALSVVGFNSQLDSARAELETPDTALQNLETLLGNQAQRITAQRDEIAQLRRDLDQAVATVAEHAALFDRIRNASGHDSQRATWTVDPDTISDNLQGPEGSGNFLTDGCPAGQFVAVIQSFAHDPKNHIGYRCRGILE